MEKMRVGIVGTGYTVGIANMHVNGWKSVSDDCELVALYDVLPGRAEQWAKEKNLDVTICQSYEELLDMVDIVSLCVPNDQHIPLLEKAYAAHKHVLLEKPISVDAQTARAAVESEPDDRIHAVGFSYRGIPALRYMKQLIDEGKIGHVYTYRETLGGCRIANHEVKLEWRMQKKTSGTGALADFGCHMIDLCDWLLRDTEGPFVEVNGMYARSVTQRADIETGVMSDVTNDDSASFTMRMQNGCLASFVASRLGVARHTIELYGEGGMMLFRDDKPNELELWLKPLGGAYNPNDKQIVQAPENLVTTPWSNAEFVDFVQNIKTNTKPTRSLKRGWYVQTLVDAAEIACETGKTIEIK